MDTTFDSCRICLEKHNLRIIFEKEYDIPIWEKIVYCASVQISQDDSLPKMICNQCLVYLDVAYVFKTMCEETDKKLRNLQLTKEIGEFDDVEYEEIGQAHICNDVDEKSSINITGLKYLGHSTHENKNSFKEIIPDSLTRDLTSEDGKTEHFCDKHDKKEIVNDNGLKCKPTENISLVAKGQTVSAIEFYEEVIVSQETTTNYQTGQYSKRNYTDNESKIQNLGSSQMLKVGDEKEERQNTSEDTVLVSEKNVFRNSLKDKVGRHIAKKITGKFPQKLHYSNNLSCQKNIESRLKEKIVLNDLNFVNKFDEGFIQNFEGVLENDVPDIGFEETVVTDNDSFPCNIRNNSEQDMKTSNSLKSAETITKSTEAYKKSKIKIKMNPLNLRRGNRKINVFDDQHVKSVKMKQRAKVKNSTKNPIKKISSKKTKDCFKCDVCGKVFSFRSHLIRHLNIHTGIKGYACEYCEQKFVNNYNLSVHMLKHTGEYPLKCELCDKGFPNPSLLKRHRASHTGETNFKCRYCAVKFTQSSSLRLHEKMHLHRPSYHCDVCYKVFSYTNSLAAHKKLHFGAKRYTCDICLVTFSRKSSLIRHMEGHYKSKRIKCRVCDMSFNSKSNYYSHLKTHCKYKCDICGDSFQSKTNLVNHVTYHKNRLKCEQCFKEFHYKTQLVRHLEKHII